jgi:hypothetical protein
MQSNFVLERASDQGEDVAADREGILIPIRMLFLKLSNKFLVFNFQLEQLPSWKKLGNVEVGNKRSECKRLIEKHMRVRRVQFLVRIKERTEFQYLQRDERFGQK